MRKPQPLPSNLAGRPFTLAQAREAGLSRSRTRASDLWTPGRGIRLPRNTDFSLLESCRALTSVTPSSAVSHITAAQLHGLRLPSRYKNVGDIHLSKNLGSGQPRRRHVVGHELLLETGDVVLLDGVPATSVQRTLMDLAPILSMDELVAVADQIVCAHDFSFSPVKIPMVEIGELKAYVARHAGFRGLCKLQDALELVRVGADSTPETELRLVLGRSPLPEFVCNFEIKGSSGAGKVAPDLACPKFRTCAEYDGAHHFSPTQQGKDHDRNFVTESLGWHQALINKHDMENSGFVAVTKIARMLVLGGWDDPHGLSERSLLGELNTRKDLM